jgi:erythritol transport system ATP-binding protein
LSIAHRILVLRRGRISAEFGPDANKDDIMAASGESVAVGATSQEQTTP